MIIRGGDSGNPGTRSLRLADTVPKDSSAIVPVIHRRALPTDSAIVLPPAQRPISENLVGDLDILYAFDLPGLFMYVDTKNCQDLGLDPASLRQLSVRNLTRRRSKPEILRPSRAVNMLRLDGDLEASLLLVDHLWPQVARGIAGDIVAGIPSRDVLAITGTGITGGVARLRYAVDRVWKSPADPKLALMRSLLVRRDDSWQLFRPD